MHHLHYEKFGTGPKTLIAFHGFGQDANIFKAYTPQLNAYTVYSFDLFFHGQSIWNAKHRLTHHLWAALFKEFLKYQNIAGFDVIAYSLGGRFALSLFRAYPNQISSLTLIAPDGLRPHFWYRMATATRLNRLFFAFLMRNRFTFIGLAKTLNRLGCLC